jgi:hypothetical protein
MESATVPPRPSPAKVLIPALVGFQDADTRVLAHSIAGCFFFGAFAAKVVVVFREFGFPSF